MPMSADEFRAAIDALGMTQTGDAGVDSFLGIGERTARRMASGEIPISDAVAMLLRAMVAHRWKPDGVRERYADSRERAAS